MITESNKEKDSFSNQRKNKKSNFFYQMLSLVGFEETPTSLQQSLEEVLDDYAQDGKTLSQKENIILLNTLKFGQIRVEDAMTPRANVIGLDVQSTFDHVLSTCKLHAYSRFPVYKGTLDGPIGFIHVRDVLFFAADAAARAAVISDDLQQHLPLSLSTFLTDIKKDVLFVPPSMLALDLLVKMQSTHTQIALVIDEYGGTDGLITINDLIEKIVGRTEGEHDSQDSENAFFTIDDNNFSADAQLTLDEFQEKTGISIINDAVRKEDIDTLGGFINYIVGHVPTMGEVVTHSESGLVFEIKDSDLRRVKRILIRRLPVGHEQTKDA